MFKIEYVLFFSGLMSWCAFVSSLMITKMEVVRTPIEPLVNPTQLGNVLFVIAFVFGLISFVSFGVRVFKYEPVKYAIIFGFSGAALFFALLIIAALRYFMFSA